MPPPDSNTNNAATGSSSLPDDTAVLSGDISLALLDHMLNGVAFCKMLFENGRPHDFVYLHTNPAFHAQTGLGTVIGKHVSEIIPGIRESDPLLFEIYGRVAAGGAPEKFETFVESLKQWFAVQVFSPRPEYFVAIFDVITERKQAEQALAESENRFSLFMDTLPAAAFIKSEDGTTLYANRFMSDVVGARAWLGKSTRDLFPPELAEKMIADDRRSLEAGYVVTEEQVPSTDGQLRLYQTHKFRIPRQGQPPLLGGIALDITERKQAEAQLQELNKTLEKRVNEAVGKARALTNRLLQVQDEERKHLARELHDETSQLLTATGAYAHSILLQSENTKKVTVHENAECIIKCITKIQSAVHDVTHALRPNLLSEFGLADSLRDFAGIWQKKNPKTTLELSLEDVPNNLTDLLNIIIYRFVQEGLTNVANHAEASHVSVQLRHDAGSNELILTMADNGKGFDPASRTEGFGLLGMQERATVVGGELTISSRPGKGVHIMARLPVNPNFEVPPASLA